MGSDILEVTAGTCLDRSDSDRAFSHLPAQSLAFVANPSHVQSGSRKSSLTANDLGDTIDLLFRNTQRRILLEM